MADNWYEHQITVIVSTQFPKDESFADQIKDSLGPWCSSAKVVSLNVPIERPK